jgi:hypothetical protein
VRLTAFFLLALLLVPTVAAFHAAPTASSEVDRTSTSDGVTWRAVDYHPNGTYALLAGAYEQDNRTRSLVAQWTPTAGLEEVYNRSGPPMVDVDVREDGTSLVVGLRDRMLKGQPGNYAHVWNNSQYATPDSDFTFYGLGGRFIPDSNAAVVSGSSLLRVEANNTLNVIDSGNGSFFRTLDFNQDTGSGFVEAAVQSDGQAVLGTIWRTNGKTPDDRGHVLENLQIYGLEDRGNALLNTINFHPNGSYALLAGRDGGSSSVLTWAANRPACHEHSTDNGTECHDHGWRYQAVRKPSGPITCIDWHESGDFALATGLEEDVVGYVNEDARVPLKHQGPGLLGCAMHPTRNEGLAVGNNGTVLRVDPAAGPVANVVQPEPARLMPPGENQTFVVASLDRGAPTSDVTARVAGTNLKIDAERNAPWWTVSLNASSLEDGRHQLVVNATSELGEASVRFPFIVNKDAFTPETPTMLSPRGLEGENLESDGRLALRWEPLDQAVVYEIQQRRMAEGVNSTETLEAGGGSNATITIQRDGSHVFRVRAKNAYNASEWSRSVEVNVVLDSDGDGVPDKRDPQPHTPNEWGDPDGDGVPTDTELHQCSNPYNASSTPSSDDDGDGIPNGIECERGTDPNDPKDPPPDEPEQPADNGTDDDPTEPNASDGESEGFPVPAAGPIAAIAAAMVALVASRQSRRSR